MTKFIVMLTSNPAATVEADGFQVYDKGDLVFFVKSPNSDYELDNITAFAKGAWLMVEKEPDVAV